MSTTQRGLSLLEVLIVMVLIATMMALSLPMLSSANAKARSELCQQNLIEIGQTIASFSQDMNALPILHPLKPTEDGLSLPEFIEPRLHTPHVTFCPSDETELSHLMGTSYQWSSRFNGLSPDELTGLLGQPMLKDREAYHAGSTEPINEIRVLEDEAGLCLSVTGDNARVGDLPRKLRLHKKDKNSPNGKAYGHEPSRRGWKQHRP